MGLDILKEILRSEKSYPGKKDKNNKDIVFEDYGEALEALDFDGWWGYVLYYPEGVHPYWSERSGPIDR